MRPFGFGDELSPGLRGVLRAILEREVFTGLLLAHGAPGTRAELEAFVSG